MPYQFFHFEVGDLVTITPLNERGVVEACMVSRKDVQYEVAYWWEGERKLEWLSSNELEARKNG